MPPDNKPDHLQPFAAPSTVAQEPSVSPLSPASTLPDAGEAVSHAQGLVGKVLDGRYPVEKELGRGGIGAVYLARDSKLVDKPVVIKVLLEKSLQNEWATRKFKQEKEALARVDHPGIVGILDAGDLPDGKPYIVMQYVDGVTLRSVLRPEGIGLERAACFIKQMGAALSAAHEKGILHRDLKPENIMLQLLSGEEEQVKIIDFGVAKVRNSKVAPSTILSESPGTALYMSPEQLHGEKLTPASDIYALGVIAYEMVSGRRPFNPETAFQLSEMQRAGVQIRPKDLRPALPDAAEAIILKALSVEPRARYQNAREFGDALEDALIGDGEDSACRIYQEPSTRSIPDNRPLKSNKPISRKLIAALGLALFLLVAGIVGAVIWTSLKAKRDMPSLQSAPPQPLSNAEPSLPAATRTLSYSLTVQKMRDGQPFQEPFESSGQEIFESGYKFRLNVSSPQAGYLYLLNQGLSESGAASFTQIYPTPIRNGGNASVDAYETIQTGWNTFAGKTGTESFWIFWSAESVAELEEAKESAFESEKGAITNAATIQKVQALIEKHTAQKPEVVKDKATQQTTVRSRGNVLATLLELEHR